MAYKKEIQVYSLARTSTTKDCKRWLRDMGAGDEYIDSLEDCSTAERLIGSAAKRCYMAFAPGLNPNVNKVRSDWVKYFNNILSSGHGSVLEHASYTFAIEGCTRVFTAEMNRHRAGVAISEGSLRYIRFDPEKGIPYWEPISIKGSVAGAILHDAMVAAEGYYRDMLDATMLEGMSFTEKKKITSMARRLLPMGISTGAVYTFNLRALRHILTMRCSEHAEEEICYICGLIMQSMMEAEPKLFGDFTLVDGYYAPKYVKV